MTTVTGSTHVNYTMAGLTLLGGIMGYAKAKSMPSLVAGAGFAAAYATSCYFIERDASFGHEISAGISLILASHMGKRAFATKKMFPAGAVASAALLAALYNGKKVYDFKYGI